MEYEDYLRTVREYDPDLDEDEAEDIIQIIVELIAVHLPESNRRDFGAELPERLQDIALSVLPSEYNTNDDVFEQVIDMQGIEEADVRRRLRAAWRALQDGISETVITRIRTQLPATTLAILEP